MGASNDRHERALDALLDDVRTAAHDVMDAETSRERVLARMRLRRAVRAMGARRGLVPPEWRVDELLWAAPTAPVLGAA